MTQYILKSALILELERRIKRCAKQRENMLNVHCYTLADDASARMGELRCFQDFLDTIEVKEVNEVPATVMVNKYGNRFISSWSGLKEYDDLKEGQEIKILIPKK